MEAVLVFQSGAIMYLPVEGQEVLRLSDGERITMFELIRRPVCGPMLYREWESVN